MAKQKAFHKWSADNKEHIEEARKLYPKCVTGIDSCFCSCPHCWVVAIDKENTNKEDK